MKLGQHLRAARTRAGMTSEQVSEFTGLHRTQICDLESEKVEGVHLKTLLKLGKCYGISLDELIGYQQPGPPPMNARELRAVNLLLSVMRADL